MNPEWFLMRSMNQEKTKILTDILEPRVSINWQNSTEYRSSIAGGKGFWSDFVASFCLFYYSFQYDIAIVVSSRKGNLFSILMGLLPCFRKPVLMIDCLWYIPEGKLHRAVKHLQMKLMARGVSLFIVWASHEVNDYSKAFGLPPEKFMYIPHHHTLEGYNYEVHDGDYIFSGGDGNRDYSTLLEAVRDLDVPVVIATRRKDWHSGASIPTNVNAFPTTPEEFRKLMAGSRMVVIPMEGGHLHSGGQQTILNAMALGKPVIVADERGAKDYITDGVDGLIVPTSDSVALRDAIKKVLNNPIMEQEFKENARKTGRSYSTPGCLENILCVANKIVQCGDIRRC